MHDINSGYQIPAPQIETVEEAQEKKKFKTLLKSAEKKLKSKVTFEDDDTESNEEVDEERK